MIDLIKIVKKNGDTVGGVVSCIISGVPVGLGEPVFDKLDADIAKSLMGINAVKGVEIGDGFSVITQKGSEHRDEMQKNKAKKGTERGRASNMSWHGYSDKL